MSYHFKGISFRPRNVIVKRYPKKTPLKQTLTYDGSMMDQLRQNLESIKQQIQKRNEFQN